MAHLPCSATLRPMSGALLLLCGSTGALAQGADHCQNATPITGPGPHAFNNTAATDSGITPSCGSIARDVWFAWTAPSTGLFTIASCSNATNDTKVAIYDGSCAGNELACNDDACGLQSRIDFNAVGGRVYIVQFGSKSAGTAGAGAFTIDLDAPVFNQANGSSYRLVDGMVDWISARNAAAASSWQGTPGHLATITSQAELDFIVQYLAPVRPWIGLFQNTASPSYSEPANGWEWVTGEAVTFINWSPGEPNDTTLTGGSEEYCEMFGNGQWNDNRLGPYLTTQYLIEYSNAGYSNYCTANNNSRGIPGRIAGMGSASAASNNLTLVATDLPFNALGVFLTSATPGFVANPGGSSGNFCLAGSVGRYMGPGQIRNSGAAGECSLLLDLTQTPTPVGFVAVLQGQTRNYQLWYRDAVGGSPTSNFTNGLRVTFD